ncbi:MAG TPA: hypothetical protein VLB83_03710 [Candidatus Paceibacterota bacterium]|nr:hypothetical protein [Candidatus Paceibacterota bacterium]
MRSSDKLGELDRVILERSERCYQRLQRETGWTNYAVARVFIVVMSILNMGTIFAIDRSEPGALASCAFLAFLSFYTLLSAAKIHGAERAAFERIAKGIANPYKIDSYFRGVRIAFLIGSPAVYGTFFALSLASPGEMLPLLIAGLVMLLATPTIYALTCDPIPPCSGRLREKIRDRLVAWRSAHASVVQAARGTA